MAPLPDKKRALRRVMAARLREIAPERVRSLSRDLCRQAARLLAGREQLHVALFAPMAHEADLTPLPALFPRHAFYFPRCLGEGLMEFRRVRSPERDFEPGMHGIPAPRETCPPITPDALDVVFVPGLAFTSAGARLGRGGGYYDRFLPRCSRARIAAAAFPEQILAAIPRQEFDVLIPIVLTAREESLSRRDARRC
ncbi:MAG: 5-formyltetrahydrofolate cyclo-ligase [Akkermansia sp.]|nr:5-formyltetrahydrofolate cyclo-ligase [Akkermansia sp.]